MNKAIIIALLLATSLVAAADDATTLCYGPCPAGTKSDSGNGNATNGNGDGCTSCPAGQFSLEQSNDCTNCPAGTYSANVKSGSCTDCVVGKWSNPGATTCDITTKQCPAGKFSLNGYDTDGNGANCANCPIGSISTVQGATKCDLCPVNKSTTATGSTTCDLNLKQCIAGKYSLTGYDNDGNEGNCKQCDIGYISTAAGATKCTQCPVNKSTTATGSTTCDLPLAQCPAGKYSTTGYDTDGKGTGCLPCNIGTYSTALGTTKCSACPVNKSTSTTGLTSCDVDLAQCPAGKYSASGYDTDGKGAGCLPCEIGFISTAVGTIKCSACPVNKSTTATGSTTCDLTLVACPAGNYSTSGYDTNGKGAGCIPCQNGFYAANAQSTKCTACADGSWANGTGLTSCEKKDKCPAGKYSANTGGYDYGACLSCIPGSYSAAGAIQCTNCVAGTYTADQGSTNCKPCEAGKWSGAGSSDCPITIRKCHAGYSSVNGYDTNGYCLGCTKCAKNTYAAAAGSTTCTACTNNRTSPEGSTVVTACVCPGSSTGDNDGVSECSTSSMLIKFSLTLLALIAIF